MSFAIAKAGQALKHLYYRAQMPSMRYPDFGSFAICYGEIYRRRIYHFKHFKIRANEAVILDVGANIGLFALWAASEYKPKTIFSYEASPVTYEFLLGNLSRHSGATTMVPIHAAVSSVADQELTIYHRADLAVASTVLAAGKTLGQPYPVKSTTLSRQITERGIEMVDLLKIDVEGHVMQVLEGLEQADFDRIRNVVLECDWVPEGAPEPTKVARLLEERGYRVETGGDPSDSNNVTLFAHRP